jgi:hypothetical protein
MAKSKNEISNDVDTVMFWLFPSFSYSLRIVLSFSSIIAGLIIQLLFGFFYPGLALVIFGNLLLLVKGVSTIAQLGKFESEANWERANETAYDDIKKLRKKMFWWDLSLFDVSNIIGGIAFTIGVIIALFVFALNYEYDLTRMIVINCGVLFLPHWLSGMRSVVKNDSLLLKIKVIRQLLKTMDGELSDCKVDYYLQLIGKEKRAPKDTKIMIKLANASEGFMGISGQLAVNSISSTLYPYFYVVLLAKKGFKLAEKLKDFTVSKKDVLEFSINDDVEILVLRQHTTRTSGYTTSAKDAQRILTEGLEAARRLVGQN